MAGGFFEGSSFTLPVSSSYRLAFSTMDSTMVSITLARLSGTSDASYRIFTSNLTDCSDDGQRVTGSQFDGLWYAEPFGSGIAFGAPGTPSAFVIHMTEIATRTMMVEVSSSSGGPFRLRPHIKNG